VILNSAIYIANELSSGKGILAVLAGVIPEIEKSLFKDIVISEAVIPPSQSEGLDGC
jgi:hypothetical protein